MIHILREPFKYESKKAGWIDIHGAALQYRNRGILITGRKESGKTTLLTYFLRKGASYVSNDSSRLEIKNPVLLLHAWPHYLRLGYDFIQENDNLKYYIENEGKDTAEDGKYLFTSKEIEKLYGIKSLEHCILDYIIVPEIKIGLNTMHVHEMDTTSTAKNIIEIYRNNYRINLFSDNAYKEFDNISKETLQLFINMLPKCFYVEYGTLYNGDIIEEIWKYLE